MADVVQAHLRSASQSRADELIASQVLADCESAQGDFLRDLLMVVSSKHIVTCLGPATTSVGVNAYSSFLLVCCTRLMQLPCKIQQAASHGGPLTYWPNLYSICKEVPDTAICNRCFARQAGCIRTHKVEHQAKIIAHAAMATFIAVCMRHVPFV